MVYVSATSRFKSQSLIDTHSKHCTFNINHETTFTATAGCEILSGIWNLIRLVLSIYLLLYRSEFFPLLNSSEQVSISCINTPHLCKLDLYFLLIKHFFFDLGVATYRFLYAIRHNDARGWGAIINDVLKFRKVIEFEYSCIVICFSYIYRIPDFGVSMAILNPTEIFCRWCKLNFGLFQDHVK